MQEDIETETDFDPDFDIEQEEEPGITPNPDGSVNVSQLDLFCAITAHLAKRHPGLMAHTRQVNAIKDAADLIVAAYAQPITKAEPGMGIEAWLASDDTGLSSLALARALCKAVGGHQPYIPQSRYSNGREHPSDPSDFGRCLRLLEAVPVLREQVAGRSVDQPNLGRLPRTLGRNGGVVPRGVADRDRAQVVRIDAGNPSLGAERMNATLFSLDDRIQVFQALEVREARAHALAGGIAIHLHQIVFPHSPACFRQAVKRGEQIAHVFGQDAAELEQLARSCGVRIIVIDKPGTDRMHVDMCGQPLKRLLERVK